MGSPLVQNGGRSCCAASFFARSCRNLQRHLLLVLACTFAAISSPGFAQSDFYDAASTLYGKVRVEASRRGALVTSGEDYDRIHRITQKLIAVAPEMRPDAGSWAWEVMYLRSSKVNAACLPGGKMLVLSGLVEQLALTDDELAAVMGHEMGHALLDHGKEAYMQRQAANVAVGILGIIAAIAGAKHHTDPNLAFNASTAIGTLGAEFLALRPYSRERELAADAYGAELAARAGFDPRGAITLQQKMAAQGPAIEFLSTHPASDTRLQQLAQVVPADAERFAARRHPNVTLAASNSPSPTAQPAASSSVGVATVSQPSALDRTPADAHALLPGGSDSDEADLSDPDAVTGPPAASMTSKYMFGAERYAKVHGCALPAATMVTRAPTYEVFDIRCSAGQHLKVRCQAGECSI
jgi:Zn-dependent protease with chaperone function